MSEPERITLESALARLAGQYVQASRKFEARKFHVGAEVPLDGTHLLCWAPDLQDTACMGLRVRKISKADGGVPLREASAQHRIAAADQLTALWAKLLKSEIQEAERAVEAGRKVAAFVGLDLSTR